MNLARELRRMSPEMRFAGIATLALIGSLFLPWYEKSFFATVDHQTVAVADNLNAFQVFTFVEAAVLLVALGVAYLVWARLRSYRFDLPGGDGLAVLLAGGWALSLLVWRLFDKPHVSDPGATIGIQWGLWELLTLFGRG